MLLKLIIILLTFCSLSFADEFIAGDYWIISTQEGKVIRAVSTKELPSPNDNELKLFKVFKVELNTQEEFDAFVNPLMENNVDIDKGIITEDRKNKLDVRQFNGKEEKIDVQQLENKVVDASANFGVVESK